MSDPIPNVKFSKWFDEDAVYDQRNLLSQDDDYETLDLYNAEAAEPGGSVKSIVTGDPTTQSLMFAEDKPEYSITAERLLWIDGRLGKSEGLREGHEGLSLIVLNLLFKPKRNNRRIDHAFVELRFQSQYKSGKDPEVIAWGPFYKTEKWNFSSAKKSETGKTDLQAGLGWAGQQLSAGYGRETASEWDEFYCDRGESTELTSSKKGTRHGVRWMVAQNRKKNEGIAPRLRIGVLIRRPEAKEPYKVTLDIEAHVSSWGTFVSDSLSRVGFNKEPKFYWEAKPTTEAKYKWHEDGLQLAKDVDVDNLGDLIDLDNRNSLSQVWLLPDALIQAKSLPQASQTTGAAVAVQVGGLATKVMTEVDQARDQQQAPAPGTTGETETAHDAVTSREDQYHSVTDRVSITQAIESGLNGRLVSLEARAAQAEARLAAQDQIILELQKSILGMG